MTPAGSLPLPSVLQSQGFVVGWHDLLWIACFHIPGYVITLVPLLPFFVGINEECIPTSLIYRGAPNGTTALKTRENGQKQQCLT